MDSDVSGSTPLGAHPHTRKMRLLAFSIGTVLAIALMYGAYLAYMQVPYIRETVRPVRVYLVNSRMPKEFAGAQFFRADATGTHLARVQGVTQVAYSETSEVTLSEDVSSATDARIVLAGGIFSVRVQGAVIATSTTPLYSIGQSQNGRYVAYATSDAVHGSLFTRPELLAVARLVPNEWSIVLYDREQHATTHLGKGVQPFFIGSSVLAYLTNEGIVVYGITSKESRVVVGNSISSVLPVTLRSPDRTTVAYINPQLKGMWVYTLNQKEGALQERARIDITGGVASYALGNSGVYTSRIVDDHLEVWHRAYGTSVSALVYLAPAGMRLSRLSLGSF